jgi:hypothetical protein
MRTRSLYDFLRPCGWQFSIEVPEEISCPECGGLLVVCWNERQGGVAGIEQAISDPTGSLA